MPVLEIASNSPELWKRRTRCCGKKLFPSIFKKLSQRSSKTALVKHTNVVKLSKKYDHSPSNWLSGTKSSKVSVGNNLYVNPYESVRVDKSRLSGLVGSLDITENEYAKWGQGSYLFMVENPHSSPLSSVKAKRKPHIKSNTNFHRVTQSYVPNDPYLISLGLSKLISSQQKVKYPYDYYTYSRQYQPECDNQYEPLGIRESTEYHSEDQLSEEKIQNYKIFLSLEKVDQIPGYPELL